jgi:hypothetical protein
MIRGDSHIYILLKKRKPMPRKLAIDGILLGLFMLGATLMTFAAELAVVPQAHNPSGVATFEIRTAAIRVQLSENGEIVGISRKGNDATRDVRGGTHLAGCRRIGPTIATPLDRGGFEFAYRLMSEDPRRECTLVERFVPTQDSVRWEVEIRGSGEPWTTAIETRLDYAADAESRFWTAWGDPDAQRDRWQDPLVWRPFIDRHWPLGTEAYCCICIPLATIAEPRHDAAISLILSPEDTQLDLTLKTTRQGSIVFSRSRHRIGEGRVLCFAADLVSHPADLRSGLGWMVNRYPEFFNPPNPAADQMAGCGAYSGSEEHFDTAKLRQMAFRINWKCSEDFPYMGMFLPPMADAQARWDRAPDEHTPGKPAWTSYQTLEDYNQWMRTNGFHVLCYFNTTEYGRKMQFPPPPQQAKSDDNLWRDQNDYLFHSDRRAAVLMHNNEPVRSECYGSVIVDPGDPAYQRHLLEQARRHLEWLPHSDGLCIDRLDWLARYNRNADDGVSWIDGKPARSLLMSWKDLMSKLGPLMHGAGKVIFVNNSLSRIEMMRHVDGFNAEWTFMPKRDAYFNYSALLGMRKPVLVWTPLEEKDNVLKSVGPDAYLQRCLYLGVFPTAPYPNNNHCLCPSALADAAYLDYGPLLDAMRGKKWVLRPHAVEVLGEKAKANLFEVPGGYAMPVAFGGQAESVEVVLREIQGLSDKSRIDAIHPGTRNPVAVKSRHEGTTVVLTVPLHRGCAMVRVVN